MLIIRRLNCIDVAFDIVTLSQWPSGWPLTEIDDTSCYINTVAVRTATD